MIGAAIPIQFDSVQAGIETEIFTTPLSNVTSFYSVGTKFLQVNCA